MPEPIYFDGQRLPAGRLDLTGDLRAGVLLQVCHGHRAAVGGERERRRATNAAGGARHESYAIGGHFSTIGAAADGAHRSGVAVG